jgi:hypothetical protein
MNVAVAMAASPLRRFRLMAGLCMADLLFIVLIAVDYTDEYNLYECSGPEQSSWQGRRSFRFHIGNSGDGAFNVARERFIRKVVIYLGRSRPPKEGDASFAKYAIKNVATGEFADGSSASGYPVNMELFRALCPSKAPHDD